MQAQQELAASAAAVVLAGAARPVAEPVAAEPVVAALEVRWAAVMWVGVRAPLAEPQVHSAARTPVHALRADWAPPARSAKTSR
jgi:hypothetical protein